ncbi:hypothetical protein AXF42_Ash012686 [Apostasia shenzhenica]|uniref:Uncharacterized protein n=1 Tax=Apostasia shenzhenica TaxID=1088818 RepID=A0A2H9ZTE3_9ASPA|nr:hypothetical protein AXF42_Ash012686 [Apostasia shenzhenica]
MWDPHATHRTATDYRKNDVLRSPNVIISPPKHYSFYQLQLFAQTLLSFCHTSHDL